MRLGEGRGLLLCAGGRRKERKIHTILSLIGLLLSVGLWGVSYFDLELGSRPAFSDKGRLLALMDEQSAVKPSLHERTAEEYPRGRSVH